jgi:hypothetical protein
MRILLGLRLKLIVSCLDSLLADPTQSSGEIAVLMSFQLAGSEAI